MKRSMAGVFLLLSACGSSRAMGDADIEYVSRQTSDDSSMVQQAARPSPFPGGGQGTVVRDTDLIFEEEPPPKVAKTGSSSYAADSGKPKAPVVKAAARTSEPPTPAVVVYFGYLKLRVNRLLEAVDAITKTAETAGGYVESLSGRVIVVRIPGKDFDKMMDALSEAGEILDRRVKALDVTEQLTDLGARLTVAKEARARLLALLERIEDVQERLRILQETKRLTEAIESIESTLATLRNLVDFYTITIELVPVLESGATAVHRSPFCWVRDLVAHLVTIEDGQSEVSMAMPPGFVRFDRADSWRAHAADTSQLRAGRVDNEPVGDNRFWADAVLYELDGRDEEVVGDGTAGILTWRVFRNKDVKPRYWLVAVHAAGKKLYVVEAFYPTEEAFKAHHAEILKALATFAVR